MKKQLQVFLITLGLLGGIKNYAQDVSTAQLSVGILRFDILTEETFATDLTFNNDGTKLFIVGSGDDSVVEYSLDIAFNINTIKYAGEQEEFYIGDQETTPQGLTFSSDGTKMFIIGSGDDSIIEYDLSTAFDVSTANYAGEQEEFYVGNQNTYPLGLAFSNNGNKMFVMGGAGSRVIEYNLSTAFDVSTANYAGEQEEFYVGDQESGPKDLTFNSDGTELFIAGDEEFKAVQYTLSSAFDVSTAIYTGIDNEMFVGDNDVRGLIFNNDGSKLYVIDEYYGLIEYSFTNGYGSEVIEPIEIDHGRSGLGVSATDVKFNNDGTKMYVLDNNIHELLEYSLITPFDTSSTVTLEAESEWLDLDEELSFPYGFSFNEDGTKIIFTENERIIEYNLTEAFDISTGTPSGVEMNVESQDDEMRDIIFNTDGTKMYLIGSNSDAVFEYNLTEAFDIATASYNDVELDIRDQENLASSIMFNVNGSKLYVLGRTNKTILEYSLDIAFDISTAVYTGNEKQLTSNFSTPRALVFNNDNSKMFIIGEVFNSDELREFSLSSSSNITQVRFVEGTTGIEADTEVTTNSYITGDDIIIRVDYDGPVIVEDTNGAPYIALTSFGKNASYVSTSVQSIFFSYTVVNEDNTENLTTAPIISLNQATSTIKNDKGVDADLGIGIIDISQILSIVDNEFNSTISVFPNPVVNTLNVSLNSGFYKAQVYNLLGKEILNSQKTTIDVSSLSDGIYLLKIITTDNKVGIKKFVKK